jgi:hypothetical protein
VELHPADVRPSGAGEDAGEGELELIDGGDGQRLERRGEPEQGEAIEADRDAVDQERQRGRGGW